MVDFFDLVDFSFNLKLYIKKIIIIRQLRKKILQLKYSVERLDYRAATLYLKKGPTHNLNT